jgi:signal transduction histidine kinase
VSLIVLPRLMETRWFAAVVVGLMLGVLHWVRVRQIARVMSARFDERLDERTRVARELHDTLLQTVHGSKMVADRALRDTTDQIQLVRTLEQLSVWLGQAGAEGQVALQSLRGSTSEKDELAAAFRRAIDECRNEFAGELLLSVRGRAGKMRTDVRDEVYRIGYEAIRNACVHSYSRRIHVTLDYGHDLTLRISDNGVGIDAAGTDRVKERHIGLSGMRERAERIGAKLTLMSGPGTGTELTLIVPSPIAFLAG